MSPPSFLPKGITYMTDDGYEAPADMDVSPEDKKITIVLAAIRRTVYGQCMNDHALKVLATVAVRALTMMKN